MSYKSTVTFLGPSRLAFKLFQELKLGWVVDERLHDTSTKSAPHNHGTKQKLSELHRVAGSDIGLQSSTWWPRLWKGMPQSGDTT